MLALVSLPLFILSTISQNLGETVRGISETSPIISAGALLVLIVIGVINLIFSILQPMALARSIFSVEKGAPLSLQEAFSPTWPAFWSYFWVIILTALVTLVAHGFFNTMIGLELRRLGWRCVQDRGFKYWSTRHFERV